MGRGCYHFMSCVKVERHGREGWSVCTMRIQRQLVAVDTRRGWFPLHFIVTSSGVSLGLICKILDLYPQAAKEVDGNGKTPLHLIVESGKDWECVETIFLANPGAIIVEDSQGKVPLIAAALSMCDSVGNMSNGGSDGRAGDVLLMESP